MGVKRCEQGHSFDTALHKNCPECARQANANITHWFRQSAMLRGYSQPQYWASGSNGVVYRVKKEGKPYALKAIDCGFLPEKRDNAHKEILLMRRLGSCRNVVRLIESEVLTDTGGTVVLLLESFETSFEEYYKTHNMTVSDVLQLGIDICTALEDCWNAGVAHLDVQPKNLFVDSSGRFCLGDFGSSTHVMLLEEEHRLRGTLSYMAPEVYENRKYSQASDIYALGMILYCVLNQGNLPFMECGSKEKAVMTRLTQKVPVPSLNLGRALDQMLQRALAADPRQRFESFAKMRISLMEVKEQMFPAPSSREPAGRNFLAWLPIFKKNKKQPAKAEPLQQPAPYVKSSGGMLFDSDSLACSLPLDVSVATVPVPFPSLEPAGGTLFDSDSCASSAALDASVIDSAPGSGILFDSDALACTVPLTAPANTMPCAPSAAGSYTAPYDFTQPIGGTLFDSDSFATSCAISAPNLGSTEKQGCGAEFVPAPRMSQVQFSAIAPKEARKEDYSIIQLFMYEQAFRAVVEEAIAMAQSPVQEKRSGFQKVRENTRVKIVLTCPDMVIEDNVLEQTWYGDYLQFDFAICPPEDFKKRQILLTAAVYFDDVPATRLMLTVKALASYEEEIQLARQDIITAFVSYASQDRTRVGALVQGMRKARPDMDIFFDVATLRSGENWESTLYREILRRDILFLCWSRNAMASDWVEREWRYALENKGLGAIEPIPLEQPDLCPPPKELWSKHFNDSLLYIINR